MSNFVPRNYDLRGQHWFFVTIWRKLLQNRIECLSKLSVSMLLVNHSASSGLKKWRFWREKRRTWKTTEKVWRQRIAIIVGWGWRSNLTTTRGSIECDTRSRFHTFEIHGKDPEDEKMDFTWTEWKTGKPLAKCCSPGTKESHFSIELWLAMKSGYILRILSVKDHG